METDSSDYDKQKEHRCNKSNDCHFLKPNGVRHSVCGNDEAYRGLLDYNIYILYTCAIILPIVFLFA